MKLRPLIGITLLAFLIVVIIIAAMECYGGATFGYNATEANDMTMHKFPAARNLAEVVGQDRYTMAQLSERVDGIIRRGVVSRVRPTGEGFEYTFPEGVDAVYLVDVEIYNPGARPVTLEGIESAIPVRPGQGVRVLIPGGDVTRGPIVMGRLTPATSEVATFSMSTASGDTAGEYPSIGVNRAWIVDIRLDNLAVLTTLPPPPTNPERHYPEAISWIPSVIINIATATDEMHVIRVQVPMTMYMTIFSNTVEYVGSTVLQRVIEIDEVADLGPRDLTPTLIVDNREVSMSVTVDGMLRQASSRGNDTLDRIAGNTSGQTLDFLSVTLSELGVGTK